MANSFSQLVERLYQTGISSDYELTEAVLDELGSISWDEASSMLYDILMGEVRKELRNITARKTWKENAEEKDRRSAGHILIRRQAGKTPRLTSQLDFLDYDVVTESGHKKYGDLTMAEHVRLAAQYLGARNTADRSLRSHQWACGMLTRHDAACLKDIKPEILSRELPRDGIKP